MRKSKVLTKLRSSGFVRMAGLGHYLPFYIRYAAHFKYDGLWFDLEHRAMDSREVQSILAMCRQHDIDCMVRPPTLERTRLYRYLEDGATGFMIPFMSTAEIARHVVDCTKFPPLGNRGIDGAGLDRRTVRITGHASRRLRHCPSRRLRLVVVHKSQQSGKHMNGARIIAQSRIRSQ